MAEEKKPEADKNAPKKAAATYIIGNIPCKVLGYDRLYVECQLNTIVLEGTYVLQ